MKSYTYKRINVRRSVESSPISYLQVASAVPRRLLVTPAGRGRPLSAPRITKNEIILQMLGMYPNSGTRVWYISVLSTLFFAIWELGSGSLLA